MRACLLVLLACVTASVAGAVTFAEGFSTDPIQDGWRMFGNTNLFQWDPAGQQLEVTWDSSQTNSYFYHPLGTILGRDDSFHLSFDLVLQDYVIGGNTNQPFTFEIAIGFFNLFNATQTNFFRGTGVNPDYGPKNLVEFNFFPPFSIFRATIAQAMVSTTNTWLYNNNNLISMAPGALYRVDLDYDGAAQRLTTTVTNNGIQYGQTQLIQVPTNFDFRVDSVSVSSYSDQYSDGSILAHGTVDNIAVTVPPPPIQNLSIALNVGVAQVQFTSRSNWLYTLQRTIDFQGWFQASVPSPGGGLLVLSDSLPPAKSAFYRVCAIRP
jgi:hypothetical protein